MRRIFFIITVFFFTGLPYVSACVGCREPAVTSLEEPQTIVAGTAFSWSVVTMLIMVLLVIGGLTSYIIKTCQRLDKEKRVS